MTTVNVRKAVGIGFATGLRTMAGPSAVRCSGTARLVLRTAALGELVVDKLPQTPSRTHPIGLVARAVSAGIAASCAVTGDDRAPAVAVAVGTALAAAFAGARYRAAMAETPVPDALSALLEDAVAYGVARAAVQLS